MILIADSGSTKTHLKLLDAGIDDVDFLVDGINPFFLSEDEIREILLSKFRGETFCDRVDRVFFYGAGCSFEGKKKTVRGALVSVFPHAEVQVESDLLCAARALFGDGSGIACILGTGSNSCLFVDGKIEKNVSPLGFILGDEGSGAVMGKRLVADCMKGVLGEETARDFYAFFDTTAAEVMDRVYRKPFPNRYLASLVPFLIEHIAEPAIYEMVKNCFCDFFDRNILQYEHARELPIGFVGSIANQFKDILKAAGRERGLNVGQIIKDPIDGLAVFHRRGLI